MNAKESLLSSLDEKRRIEAKELIALFGLSEQSQLELIKNEIDLMLFGMDGLKSMIDMDRILSSDKGMRRKAFIASMRKVMEDLERNEIDYSDFPSLRAEREKLSILMEDSTLGFGRCPCPIDGEETRCCKLSNGRCRSCL